MTRDELAVAIGSLPDTAILSLSVADLRGVVVDVAPASVTTDEPDEMLTAEQVAAKLSVTPRFCYDHAKELGAKKLSRKCVRFSSRAVTRYLARRHA